MLHRPGPAERLLLRSAGPKPQPSGPARPQATPTILSVALDAAAVHLWRRAVPEQQPVQLVAADAAALKQPAAHARLCIGKDRHAVALAAADAAVPEHRGGALDAHLDARAVGRRHAVLRGAQARAAGRVAGAAVGGRCKGRQAGRAERSPRSRSCC
jgi:hypothetical protein